MNPERKEKLRNFIIKLPLGVQLLQLRRKMIKVHRHRKKEYERKILELHRRRIKEHKRKIECKRKKLLHKFAVKYRKKREKLLRKSLSPDVIFQLMDNERLCNNSFYYTRSKKNSEIFQKYSKISFENAIVFEFGAGKFLAAPIGLSLLGFKKVITTDIARLANPEYVQTVIKFYRKHKKFFGIKSCPKIKEKITEKNLNSLLLEKFNVDYRAPYDTAHTDLPDNSVDYVFANVVFEHIKVDLLPGIVNEVFRILRGGGVFYTTIDFSDHRAHKNSKLTIYDYLQYSNAEWCVFDKDSNQKNRLRTSDHLAVFKAAGFEILEVKKQKITDEDHAAFATVKVADEFRQKYTDEELMEKGVNIVLRKPFSKLSAENQTAPSGD